eukprot:10487637-Prorocentrum_lima.AAC.1
MCIRDRMSGSRRSSAYSVATSTVGRAASRIWCKISVGSPPRGGAASAPVWSSWMEWGCSHVLPS